MPIKVEATTRASQIAQAHRGTLSVTSDVDQMVFTFVVPISVGTRQ
jgi:hypothetical protein